MFLFGSQPYTGQMVIVWKYQEILGHKEWPQGPKGGIMNINRIISHKMVQFVEMFLFGSQPSTGIDVHSL